MVVRRKGKGLGGGLAHESGITNSPPETSKSSASQTLIKKWTGVGTNTLAMASVSPKRAQRREEFGSTRKGNRRREKKNEAVQENSVEPSEEIKGEVRKAGEAVHFTGLGTLK